MSETRTYHATAERDGPVWLIRVPEIDRVTQARRLDHAEASARDLIAIMTGEEPDSFVVEVHPELERGLSEIVARAATASRAARAKRLEASIATRQAAEALDRSGLTVRDIGNLLGLSYQRVQQLLSETAKPDMLRERLRRETAPR